MAHAAPRDGELLVAALGGVALVSPISRTSEIDVNLWPAAPGLRVVIWHQGTGAATYTRLAAVPLPAWLLVVLGMVGPFVKTTKRRK